MNLHWWHYYTSISTHKNKIKTFKVNINIDFRVNNKHLTTTNIHGKIEL